MLTKRFGDLLRNARTHRNISRVDLARAGGVSLRLVAELEQGKRPNVSLESALRLLKAAGVSVVARSPDGEVVEIRDPAMVAAERAQRAAIRRATWGGGHVHGHAASAPPAPVRGKANRLAAVAVVSRQVGAIAESARIRAKSLKG